MRLTASIPYLKRQARLLSRSQDIPLHLALDRVAAAEGFGSWSLLASKAAAQPLARRPLPTLAAGDLLLLGARPGQGKTLMSLELAVEAMKAGRRSLFFTLEYTARDIVDRFRAIGADIEAFADRFTFDNSDAISAAYIIERLASVPRETLVVVDYLQLLDQRRDNPDLMVQIRMMRAFAREKGLVMVFISQIDRSYDATAKPCPDLGDVRLPNPLDLALFDKTCFLNGDEIRFGQAA